VEIFDEHARPDLGTSDAQYDGQQKPHQPRHLTDKAPSNSGDEEKDHEQSHNDIDPIHESSSTWLRFDLFFTDVGQLSENVTSPKDQIFSSFSLISLLTNPPSARPLTWGIICFITRPKSPGPVTPASLRTSSMSADNSSSDRGLGK
jgi:hypothetical protein